MTAPQDMPPFVLDVAPADRARHTTLDVYRSATPTDERRPVVVLVHGGPLPPTVRPAPRDWPLFVGYASLAAEQLLIGVVIEHRLHSPADYPQAADDLAAAIEQTRALPDADPDRVALWFFSGGGLLAADWLAASPPWLRCVALTYPILAPMPGWQVDSRFRPIDVAGTAEGAPVIVTRVGRENPDLAAVVDAFISAARAADRRLEVIDVPDGQHAFDMLDHTDDSRAAVHRAMDRVAAALHH